MGIQENKWPGKLTREDAIRILDRATCQDDPYWENVVEDFYDEGTDTLPTIYAVFEALGVSTAEVKAITGAN